MQNFKEELTLRIERVNDIIKKEAPKREGYQKTVMEAMDYALLGGGKRIRPILMWETYRLFDGKEEGTIEAFMAAMEMVHTYSLVHDDLPSMDDDDTRRGRKTTHIVYGEAMALLAGDALLNYAFEMASKALTLIDDKERGIQAFQVFAKKAGIYGMIGGQVVDVERNGEIHSLDTLQFIYQKKTCALLEASMVIGAIIAGANEKEVTIIEELAGNVGLAFQIKDDVLDVTSTQEILGKPIGSDEKNHKTTHVTLLGLKESEKAIRDYSNKAIGGLQSLPYENDFLRKLIEWLIDRDN